MAEGPVPITVFRVNDPVHGSIEIEGKEIGLIIDTPEFQRLRKIKQLGGVCYVYPGANHTRFEHSIGVCYIASELLKHLQEYDCNYAYYKSLRPKNEEIRYDLCVKIAALCHDLGHGPYSHLYDFVREKNDKLVNEDVKKLCQHEYRSVKILEKIHKRLEQKQGYTINETEIIVIGKMITFSKDYKSIENDMNTTIEGILKDKAYFYEIVANGFTGIDVDKMDYFIRDGHGMGLSSSFEWRRYIQTLKILPVDGPEGTKLHRLCSRDKEAPELYQLFHIRNQLNRQGYYHKTSECVQKMMGEALTNASKLNISVKEGYVTYAINGDGVSILKAWQDIDVFLHLTDTIEDTIMQQPKQPPDEPITKAREIFHRIKERKLWKFIGQVGYDSKEEDSTKKRIESIRKDIKQILKVTEEKDLIAVQEVKFNYGMKETDPIEHHWFYGKTRPGEQPKPYHLKQNQVSRMLPTTFLETKVFFYYKSPPPQEKKELEDHVKLIECLQTAFGDKVPDQPDGQ